MTEPIGTRLQLIETIAQDLDGLCQTVAADVEETPAEVRDDVQRIIRLLSAPEGGPTVVNRARREVRDRAAAAATDGLGHDQLLDRYLSTIWAIWEAATALEPDAKALMRLGTWLLRGADLAGQAIAEGYTSADRALLARDVTARRAFLDEVVSATPVDSAGLARLRRMADRYGLDPTATYRLVAIAEQPAGDDEAHVLADRLGRLVGAPSSSDRARSGITLPQVFSLHGKVVVLARADWPGLSRLRSTLDGLKVGWVAVQGKPIAGVEGLSSAMSRLADSLRAAERFGRSGWIEDPDAVAVERLLLLDDTLLAAIVRRELGALLAVPRMGPELVETLRVYFEAGENMRETARRLHLASRTVAYRLERIGATIGRPIDDEARARLSVALLAYQALGNPTEPPPQPPYVARLD
jgi:hypothetical protein